MALNLLQLAESYFQTDLPDNPFAGTTGTTGEAEAPAAPESFADSDPLRFQILKEWVQDQDIPATLATRFVEEWGQRAKQGDRYPDLFDLASRSDFMNGLMSLKNYTTLALPQAFKVQFPDGTIKTYNNSVTRGLQEIPTTGPKPFDEQVTSYFNNLPVYTLDQFQSALAAVRGDQPKPPGGGSGSGRGELVMDRNQLRRRASDIWRYYLLEEPGNIDSVVDEFISDATNFWRKKGGQKDFETWMLDRIEGAPRGRVLYNKRPDGMTMDEYLTQYRNVASQAGLSGQSGVDATVRGLQSGAEAVPFLQQLERSSEVLTQQGGTWSQKFANQMAQMGIRGT